MKHEYAILGLSTFGETLAMELEKAGGRVIVVDRNSNRVQKISDLVSQAVCANAQDEEILEELDIAECRSVVVAMPNYFHSVVLITHYLHKKGQDRIYVQVTTDEEGEAIKAVGAYRSIIPDVDVGLRMAGELLAPGTMDRLLLNGNLAMSRLACREEWAGKTLRQLNLRKKHEVNVIAILSGENLNDPESINLTPDPDTILDKEDALIVVATVSNLATFQRDLNPSA